MKTIKIEIGEFVIYSDRKLIISRVLDMDSVMCEDIDSGDLIRLKIADLRPSDFNESDKDLTRDLISLSDEDMKKAQQRFSIIKPILENRGSTEIVMAVATKEKVHYTTLYRWVNLYEETGQMSSLLGKEKTGGRGQSRLDDSIEAIIKKAIEETYLTTQRKPVNKTMLEVQQKCHAAGLQAPHANTIRNRILNTSEEEKLRLRYSRRKAKEKFEPIKGSFPGATFPLSTVQIDHTLLDIILVDEIYRKPVGRPWITIALDTYSRMVIGFYISFDPPGAVGTGLCIANSILPKEIYLSKIDVQGSWPCWGVMKTIHVDNAKEFRGTMLQKACDEYGIQLEWRPPGRPNWGGNVERVIGTLLKEIQTLPGTTFSNIKQRQEYDSEQRATLTLNELEKWLATFLINVYHKRVHSTLKMSPQQKFEEGIIGTTEVRGTGLPPRIFDERKLRLDFMPFEERTVQEYGVVIDHIHYYHDILRKYINVVDPGSGKSRLKKKFIFKRDPRDISVIYFYDPQTNDHYPIPYRDTSRPPMSIWEFNEVIKRLNQQDIIHIDENTIFQAYAKMHDIEQEAIKSTKKIKRLTRSVNTSKTDINRELKIISESKISEDSDLVKTPLEKKIFKPFEDIEDGAFKPRD